MEAKHFTQMAADAKRKRDLRVRAAITEIVDASDEYIQHIDGLRQLKSLVEGDPPDVFAERLDLTEFDGWDALRPTTTEPDSDIGRIRHILPPRNEQFCLRDLKRRFREKFPEREIGEKVWPVYLSKLCRGGEIIRVQRQQGGRPGVYATKGSDIAEDADSPKKSQPDMAIDILRESGSAMTLNELVAELRRHGAGEKASDATLRQNIIKGFRRREDKVRNRGGKWMLTD